MRRLVTESAVRVVITALVGGIGAAAGFTHTHQAAYDAGQPGWLAWADAVVIECMVVVAGLQLAAKKTTRQRIFPGAVLVVAFLVQMGAQVSSAPRNFAGWLFAALPALGCLVVAEFALSGLRSRAADQPVSETPAEPETSTAAVQADTERTDQAGEVLEADPWPQLDPALPVSEPVPAATGWPGWGEVKTR